jgi:hypothetical protein
VNFARLNHILIPTSREGRDRFRRSLIGRLFGPTRWLYDALSDEGRALALLTLFVGMMSLEVATTQTYLLWSSLFAALAGAVMVRPAFRLRAVELRLDAPARVPVGEPLRVALTLVNGSERHHSSKLAR